MSRPAEKAERSVNNRTTLNSVPEYSLMVAGVTLVGALSCGVVLLIDRLVNHPFSASRRERVFLNCSLAGLAVFGFGQWLELKVLAAASALLWGWLVLPMVLVPVFVIWTVAEWLWRLKR